MRNKAATRASDGRFIWRFLLLMPVLTWFALVVFSMVTCPRLPKTGDALLDKLVSTLNDGLVQGYLHVTPYFISLPDDVLAGWEPEFGDDPRYWMLRYQLTEEVPAEYQSIHADLDVRPQVYYLEEARRRGIADGPLLYKLLSEYPHLWFEEGGWWGFNLHSCRDEPYQRNPLDISSETERRQLLDELLAASPDEAIPRYLMGMLEAELGNYEYALEQIEAGNNALCCSNMIGFPFCAVENSMRDRTYVADQVTDGLLLFCIPHGLYGAESSEFPIGLVIALTRYAAEQENRDALNILQAFACRFGQAHHIWLHCPQLAAEYLYEIQWHFGNVLGWQRLELFDIVQQEAYFRLHPETKSLSGIVFDIYTDVYDGTPVCSIFSSNKVLAKAQKLFDKVLDHGALRAIKLAESTYACDAISHETMNGPIAKDFKALEKFDYATLSWEE